MKNMKSLLLLGVSTLLGNAFAGQSPFAYLDATTGDFGGAPFNLRSEFETYIDTDSNGDVVEYGFYVPLNSRLGVDQLGPTDGLGAALDFDKSALPKPQQMPFDFVGINYNPGGHPEYFVPHYDFHLWLFPSEYARGIECDGTGFPPCQTTPFLAQKFSKNPHPSLYPAGYVNDPMHWVPTMGAHLIPNPIPGDFDTVPAFLYGSYNGDLLYHEPMVANTILDTLVNPGDEVIFNWPKTAYPKPGRYYTRFKISNDSGLRYKFSFIDLVDAPEMTRGYPVFIGASASPFMSPIDGPVSPRKDCVIATPAIADGGWMVTSAGEDFCCRAKGRMTAGACVRSGCNGDEPLSSASDFFSDGAQCFSKCIARA